MGDRCRDPSVGFGIADIYRSVGELFVEESSAMDRSAPSAPGVPVPLVKSHSAPVVRFGNAPARAPSVAELFMDADLARGADDDEAEAMSEKYECRGCGSRDRNKVSKNRDSSLVCDRCGVVQGQYAVACDRQKMCARADDKTDTADPAAQTAPSHAAVGMSRADGAVESALQTRARHVATLGGTRIPLQVIKKHRLGSSESRARTDAMRDARERGEVDSEVERKLRRVLAVVETTFDHLHLHKSTEEAVRKDAVRVVEIAVKHARCCHGSECQVPLASKPSALFGVCAVQASLEKLERGIPSDAAAGQRAPLRQNIDRVKQLRLQGSALNGTQRSVTTAAVGIALGWGVGMANLPCRCSSPAQPAAPPPLLALPAPAPAPAAQALPLPLAGAASPLPDSPPPLSPAPDLAGEAAALPVYPVRDRIEAAVRSARLSESLRRAALAAIQTPEAISWMERERLPADVAAIAVLSVVSATREAGQQPPALAPLRATLCYQHALSTTTADAAEAGLAKLLAASTSYASFGGRGADGIF